LLEIPQQDSRGGPDIGNHHFQWEIKIIQHDRCTREKAKSQSGTTITLGKGSIYATTRKQKTTAQSASEAELIAAVDGAKTMVAMRNYLISRKYPVDKMVLFQDNKASQFIIDKGIQISEKDEALGSEIFCSN
jgi:hypothetical protein